MFYYLIPKQKITPENILKLVEINRGKFKAKIRIEGKAKYIWSISFEDKILDNEISIFLTLFYENNSQNLEGIRLLNHNPTVVKNEFIYSELKSIFDQLFSLSSTWEIYDLFLEEFIEQTFWESLNQYSSMYRSILENLYSESKMQRSLYVKIIRLDMQKIQHKIGYIDKIIDSIDKITNPKLQKLYLYQLSIHSKNSTLSTSQYKRIHHIINKHENIKNDLCFISKLNLYIDEYNIYKKVSLNKGNRFVKKSFVIRKYVSDYMYSLLIEYYYQRGDIKSSIEFALADFDNYSSEFSREFLNKNIKKLKALSRIKLFLKINISPIFHYLFRK